jgi:hypothetical protein
MAKRLNFWMNRCGIGVLAITGACTSSDSGKGEGAKEPVCGLNSVQAEDGACVCETGYGECPDGSSDCCPTGFDVFEVRLVDMTIHPLKPDGSPWDWDGDIPDWLIEVAGLIGTVEPHAATLAEVLQLVDEVAPELLEGTVPPDPFVAYWHGDRFLFEDRVFDDTYDHFTGVDFGAVDLSRGELYLEVTDEDLLDHDFVGYDFIDIEYVHAEPSTTLQYNFFPFWEVTWEVVPVE